MKMYIVVKDTVPLGLAITAVAHASMSAALTWRNSSDFEIWRTTSFKKVVCKANQKEFTKIKEFMSDKDIIVLTESALNNEETAIVLLPRENKEWPNVVKYLKLYK